ncbi:hypothetical protein [Georgenia faecalis]|uniref:Uncharacterized protein n=1 Tax=Georgenia faecalis TaxID=2483799 RepID=A0ABV9DBY5_9MICO|nr:hypothetical protein [Georgenia faecalis]
MKTQTDEFEMLPMLARGKHRNPRKGACFMELASFLAGERWSDSPPCTHPLLAHLARLVNDLTDDTDRPQLAPLIPSVIGLRSTDPRWDHELTLLAASRALPVAAESHQRALAVGILTCERLLAVYEGRPEGTLTARSREAFEQVPLVEQWARAFIARTGVSGSRHPGAAVLECATLGIASACVADPATRLRELLVDAITLCEELAGRRAEAQAPPLEPADWIEVCRPAAV